MAKKNEGKGKGAAVVNSKTDKGEGKGEGKGAAVIGAACPPEGFEGLPKVKPAAVAGLPEVKGFMVWKPPFKGIGAAFKDGAALPAGAAGGFVIHCVNMARRFFVLPDKAGKAAALAAEVVEGKAAGK